MATKLGGPWSVQYPLRYYSGGDTTAQGFGKHIQEIARIYGLLNALDTGKIDSEDALSIVNGALGNLKHNSLKEIQGGQAGQYYHLTQTQVSKLNNAAAASDVIKQHNNLQDIQGGNATERYHLTQAQVSKLDASAAASDVIKNHNSLQGLQGGAANNYHHLTQAQLAGLTNLMNNPPSAFDGEQIAGNGYIKFENGLMMQWGKIWLNPSGWAEATPITGVFPITFPIACYNVVAGTSLTEGKTMVDGTNAFVDAMFQVTRYTNSTVSVMFQILDGQTATTQSIYANYVAFGK